MAQQRRTHTHIHMVVHAGALQTLRPRSVPNSKVPTASMEGESPTNNKDKYIVAN